MAETKVLTQAITQATIETANSVVQAMAIAGVEAGSKPRNEQVYMGLSYVDTH